MTCQSSSLLCRSIIEFVFCVVFCCQLKKQGHRGGNRTKYQRNGSFSRRVSPVDAFSAFFFRSIGKSCELETGKWRLSRSAFFEVRAGYSFSFEFRRGIKVWIHVMVSCSSFSSGTTLVSHPSRAQFPAHVALTRFLAGSLRTRLRCCG